MLQEWIPIGGPKNGKLKIISKGGDHLDANKIFGSKKNDHEILNAALRLRAENPDMRVILVSKDINLRFKARALDLEGQVYETVQVKNIDQLDKGKIELILVDPTIIAKLYEKGKLEPEELM